MNNKGKITPYQLFSLIIGGFIGPGFLKMPNILAQTAKQDAWIAAIVALIYPFTMILLCCYIAKRVGSRDIIDVTKDYMGKYLGSIVGFLFLLQSLIFTVTITGDLISISETYVVGFLTPLKITVIGFFISIYTSSKDIDTISKVNELIVFFISILILLSLSSFKNLSLLNIQPVLGSGIKNIALASKDTAYVYIGAEVLLFFNKYVFPRENILKYSLLSIVFSTVIWVSTTLITLLFLGPDIVLKSKWPFIYVYSTVNLRIISNFMYIFIYIWSFIIFNCLGTYLFMGLEMLSTLTTLKKRNLTIILTPLLFFFALILYKQKYRSYFIDIFSFSYVLFNYIYVLSLILLIKIRDKKTKNI